MFQRGFKSWCEKAASQYRKELCIDDYSPIDSRKLADYLSVTVWMADEVPGVAKEALNVLLNQSSDCWSAITSEIKGRYLVVLNPKHSDKRQNNDLMHELAHIILKHKPCRIDVTVDGLILLKDYNKNQEDEADWLAGSLLLPRKLLMKVARSKASIENASDELGVSVPMLKYRLNVTGVERQLKRGSF